MKQVAAILVLGLALASALASMGCIHVKKLNEEVPEMKQASNLIEQDNSDLKKDLEQENQPVMKSRDTESSHPSLGSVAGDGEGNQNPGLLPGMLFPKEEWGFRGNDTPEDILLSIVSSWREHNFASYVDNYAGIFTPEAQELMDLDSKTEEEFLRETGKMDFLLDQTTGIRVRGSDQIDDNTIKLRVILEGTGAASTKLARLQTGNNTTTVFDYECELALHRIDGKWYCDPFSD